MNKDTMLIKMLAELFNDHAYIQRVVFDRNSKYNTICYITFQCSHARVMYNNVYYWCDIKHPNLNPKKNWILFLTNLIKPHSPKNLI